VNHRNTQRIPQKALTSSRNVEKCKALYSSTSQLNRGRYCWSLEPPKHPTYPTQSARVKLYHPTTQRIPHKVLASNFTTQPPNVSHTKCSRQTLPPKHPTYRSQCAHVCGPGARRRGEPRRRGRTGRRRASSRRPTRGATTWGSRSPSRTGGRGSNSFTSQLNLSALYGIGGARRDCVARARGVLGGV